MAPPTYHELLEENRQLRRGLSERDRQIGELEARVAQLEARVVQLEQLLERVTRSNKRQAAPFSKGSPKDNPKKPNRKRGKKYRKKAHRPLPEQKPDEVIDVPLPEQCPDCGGDAEEDHIDHQFQVEIPRRPVVRRFDIHVGECTRCGRRIQPRHALQTSDAMGAAASQLGPGLQALIAMMKDKYGLSYGDIQGVLDEAFGISVTRGRLEKRLDRLLEWHLSHDGNQKFQNHLDRHHDGILTFLYEADIEATNWPAEQAIRPAVVNRKVFGGNRTPAGAHAQEILGSVFATCAQQMCDALTFLSSLIRAPTDHRPAHVSRLLPASTG